MSSGGEPSSGACGTGRFRGRGARSGSEVGSVRGVGGWGTSAGGCPGWGRRLRRRAAVFRLDGDRHSVRAQPAGHGQDISSAWVQRRLAKVRRFFFFYAWATPGLMVLVRVQRPARTSRAQWGRPRGVGERPSAFSCQTYPAGWRSMTVSTGSQGHSFPLSCGAANSGWTAHVAETALTSIRAPEGRRYCPERLYHIFFQRAPLRVYLAFVPVPGMGRRDAPGESSALYDDQSGSRCGLAERGVDGRSTGS